VFPQNYSPRGKDAPPASSVVRGTLDIGEKAAGAVGPALFDAQAGFGVLKEATAAYHGTCH
jgi:hypothetical protein